MIPKKTAKRIFLALTLAAVVAISATVLRAQSNEQPINREQQAAQPAFVNTQCDWLCQLRERQAQLLEGSWVMIVTAVAPPGVPPPPVRTNYTSFARGGVSIGSDRLAPLANPQHGAWEHRGGNEFAWTLIADNFDPMGDFLGTLKVTSKLTLTGRNEFVGVNSSEIRNAAGTVVFRGCNTLRGERIQVESVREDCRSTTPPQ